MKFADIKAKAEKGEPLDPDLHAREVTITIDNTFEVVSSSCRGTSSAWSKARSELKNTYVLFGAHLDHVGYSQTGGGVSQRRRPAGAQRGVAGAR